MNANSTGQRPGRARFHIISEGGNTMALFDFFKNTRIDQGMIEYAQTPGAVLLDVRSPDEFRKGRIPGSTKPRASIRR